MQNDQSIVYEQPLNELVRVCLRLEMLFKQIDHQLIDMTEFGCRLSLTTLMHILQLLDRPDLKAKLTKELQYQSQQLHYLRQFDIVDQDKLEQVINELDKLSSYFIENNRKLGQSLRDIELINALRLHIHNPGGACNFDIPQFHQWLKQDKNIAHQIIMSWLDILSPIRSSVTHILSLIRENSKQQSKSAENGFYQELLDPQSNLKLVRIILDASVISYPEISLGRHFLSIRFFEPNIETRPIQKSATIHFKLTYG
jgi:cell division protein ZapD